MKNSNVFKMSLLAFFMATLFFACTSDQKELTELKVQATTNSDLLKFKAEEQIGKIQGDELSFSVDQEQVKRVMESNYKDGTKMEEVYLAKEEGQYYLYGKGFNAKKESRIIRYLLKADGDILATTTGGTDSCSGVNCSYCVFTAGSGCDCERTGDPWSGETAYCNHSTSTGMASLQLLNSAIGNAEVNSDGGIQGTVSAGEVDPQLLERLYGGEPFSTDTDFVIPAERVQSIYGNSGFPPPTEGDVTIAAGDYEVQLAQDIIIIVIVTEDVVVVVIVVIA